MPRTNVLTDGLIVEATREQLDNMMKLIDEYVYKEFKDKLEIAKGQVEDD